MNQNKLMIALGAVVGVLVLAVVAVTGVILARGGGGGGDSANTPQAAGPRVAGELRLLGDDPLTLDPAQASDTSSATYIVEIFSGLVTLDKDLKIVPDIAKEWQVSSDGTKYTFKLRDDVVFSGSNRKVTAADFKYSMERVAAPDTDSPTADTYLGDIIGVRDVISGRAKEVSGLKVIDDTTLEITIDAPKQAFLAKLTYPTAFVVDKDQIEKDKRNWSRKPNGTGPFKLQEWRIGERVVLVPNERYYGNPKPSLTKITFNLAGGSGLTQYENNEINITSVTVNDIERVRDKGERLNKEFTEKTDLSTSYIGLNTRAAPFDDPKVRQAFAMAIDKQRLTDVILKKILPPANAILPPTMPGFNKDVKAPAFDPAAAKRLLQESKYAGKLPRVVLTLSGTGQNIGPINEAILEMWKSNLGVEIETEQVETATFFQDIRRNKYQMWTQGWSADYADPENFLDTQFHSQSRQNDTKYSNPQVDRLLEQARTERDQTKRFALYSDAERLILQDAPWIPLFYGATAELVKPYVKGYANPGMVSPIYRYVSIEK